MSDDLLTRIEMHRLMSIGRHPTEQDRLIRDLWREVERLTLTASEHRDGRLAALERATAAESRLRELASAEPVAWWSDWSKGIYHFRNASFTVPLIRRPEMPRD